MVERIAIASGKGGVGKTFVAASLGHALAECGHSVLLFDGDLGLANLDIQLGVDHSPDLAAVVQGRASLREATVHHGETGVDVLIGRSGCGALAQIEGTRLERLCGALERHAEGYDFLLLDLAAGVGGSCRRLVRSSDRVLLVTTDEPTALTDAYAFVKVAVGRRCPVELVVNQADQPLRGVETHETLARACRHFLGVDVPLLGTLRRDPRVAEAIRSQKPYLGRFPTSHLAGDLRALARRLARHAAPRPAHALGGGAAGRRRR